MDAAFSVPKCCSNPRNTAWSMGSSLLFGLLAMAAHVSTWSAVNPSLHQIFSEMMVMFAVVSVPVLSEHNTFMDAISCKAVKCVTMAFFSAMVDAPIAMVTWITSGSAMGTAATMMARSQSSIGSSPPYSRCPRWMHSNKVNTMMSTMVTEMMPATTDMIFCSKKPISTPLFSWMAAIPMPISVCTPVLSHTQNPSPILITHPLSMSGPYCSEGTFRGSASPVRAAVST
mmetsp:Transcript_49728/g.98264  ORF Transcript_49728/g.98264 Transcript_49728/m.98264 type:complete len:229 (-) Transcript_49728:478-1164(-)